MEATAFRVALLRDFTRNVMGAWRLALARGHDAHYSSPMRARAVTDSDV